MGLVRINEKQAWLCSARIFDDLCTELQNAFAADGSTLAASMTAVLESKLHWWSLAELGADPFQSVVRAVTLVQRQRGDQGPKRLSDLDAYAMFMDRLDALCRSLQSDQRAGQLRSPA